MYSSQIMNTRHLTLPVVEKERKKAEKAKKFADKQAKTLNNAAAPATSKTKEKKAKQETTKDPPLPEYVEETPPGKKKCKLSIIRRC